MKIRRKDDHTDTALHCLRIYDEVRNFMGWVDVRGRWYNHCDWEEVPETKLTDVTGEFEITRYHDDTSNTVIEARNEYCNAVLNNGYQWHIETEAYVIPKEFLKRLNEQACRYETLGPNLWKSDIAKIYDYKTTVLQIMKEEKA